MNIWLFFDLDEQDIKNKKVLDSPSGASSFIATAQTKGIDVKGIDVLYQHSLEQLEKQGKRSIDKIYKDVSWMKGHSLDFYRSIENHRTHREEALQAFVEHYNNNDYIFMELPKLDFPDDSFDLVLSSHLLFVYDDRFSCEFHKLSILEMLRVSKEVRIFPLVDFQNKRMEEKKNFSPYVYQIIEV